MTVLVYLFDWENGTDPLDTFDDGECLNLSHRGSRNRNELIKTGEKTIRDCSSEHRYKMAVCQVRRDR